MQGEARLARELVLPESPDVWLRMANAGVRPGLLAPRETLTVSRVGPAGLGTGSTGAGAWQDAGQTTQMDTAGLTAVDCTMEASISRPWAIRMQSLARGPMPKEYCSPAG